MPQLKKITPFLEDASNFYDLVEAQNEAENWIKPVLRLTPSLKPFTAIPVRIVIHRSKEYLTMFKKRQNQISQKSDNIIIITFRYVIPAPDYS